MITFNTSVSAAISCFILSACITPAQSQISYGIAASDEVLLATLASLAQRGSPAICMPEVIEKEFGIALIPRDVSPLNPENNPFTLREYYELNKKNLNSKDLESASFNRSRSPQGDGCNLRVKFAHRRLCGLDTLSTSRIMGVQMQPRIENSYHPSWSSGIVYIYKFKNGKESKVIFDHMPNECGTTFTVIAIGDWK